MAREPQWKILVSYLREKGGNATLRQIHEDCWIQNVPDAKMQAKRKGFDITVENLHPNPKIASYVLHESIPKGAHIEKEGSGPIKVVQGSMWEKIADDQPTKSKAYDL